MTQNMRCAAIITGPETHLDHLGVLSSLLQIPLIVTEEKTYALARQYYPDIDVSLKDFAALSLEYLAQNFDAIFETGKFWATELRPFFDLLFHKRMRFVFCPHGNSDKGYSLQNHVEQDISLVYGDHLSDLLTRTGAADKIKHFSRTGNYRYPYYLKHRAFYDALVEEKIVYRFVHKKPVILYAPTWQDRENPTSFFSHTDGLIEQLTQRFNLVIKLHPFLIEDFPAQTFQVIARYEDHPSALFLTDFPPIYPLLARCDLYLGDYSSIGYDFLAFDKPLFFLNPQKNTLDNPHWNTDRPECLCHPSPLHTCGLEIPMDKEKALNEFLAHSFDRCTREFASQRQKIYAHAFGKEIPPKKIKADILKKLS